MPVQINMHSWLGKNSWGSHYLWVESFHFHQMFISDMWNSCSLRLHTQKSKATLTLLAPRPSINNNQILQQEERDESKDVNWV